MSDVTQCDWCKGITPSAMDWIDVRTPPIYVPKIGAYERIKGGRRDFCSPACAIAFFETLKEGEVIERTGSSGNREDGGIGVEL